MDDAMGGVIVEELTEMNKNIKESTEVLRDLKVELNMIVETLRVIAHK